MGKYYENLSLFLKAGYSMAKANKLASKVTRKQKEEEEQIQKEKVKSECATLLEKYKIR